MSSMPRRSLLTSWPAPRSESTGWGRRDRSSGVMPASVAAKRLGHEGHTSGAWSTLASANG